MGPLLTHLPPRPPPSAAPKCTSLLDLDDDLLAKIFSALKQEGTLPGSSHAHLAALRLASKRSRAVVDRGVQGVYGRATADRPLTSALYCAPWRLRRVSLFDVHVFLAPYVSRPAWQATLVSLRLVSCGLQPEDLACLCSMNLSALEDLALGFNPMLSTRGRVDPMAEADWPRLKQLDLRRTGTTSVEALLRARWTALESLSLGGNQLARPEELCSGRWALALLDLRDTEVSTNAATSLRARWPHAIVRAPAFAMFADLLPPH